MKPRLYIVLVGILITSLAWACCSVGIGKYAVFFSGQRNIIVWDPATKTEHFVRQAMFRTEGASLGFIAPTPSIPNLEEVDAAAFKTLDDTEPRHEPMGGMDSAAAGAMDATDLLPTVVQEMDIAGYHAVTLKANTASGLAKWMKQYGYSTTQPVEEWTKFHIKKNWYLTCFKVLSDSKNASTGLVKMSFTTERPFNPYLVPSDNFPENEGESVLGLYFVGPGVYSPAKDGTKQSLSQKWVARLSDDTISKLKTQLKLASMPETATITAYEDWKFPNLEASDDVYFDHSGNAKPPKGEFPIFWVVVAVAFGTPFVLWLIFRDRAK